MIATCCAFLLAVCVGALYQFAAAKYLEKIIDPTAYVPVTAQIIIDRGPGFLLNIEFFAFLAGAVGVVTYSIILLKP